MAAWWDGVVEALVGACPGARLLLSQLPAPRIIDIPDAHRVGPECGLAFLHGAQPAAASVMLSVLSIDGQTPRYVPFI